MEHYEKLVLDAVDLKPVIWLIYVDDTFVVCPNGPARLQEIFHHLNSLKSTTQLIGNWKVTVVLLWMFWSQNRAQIYPQSCRGNLQIRDVIYISNTITHVT
jgi:hypothetical protein